MADTRDDMRVCYACSTTFSEDCKVSASHDGLPVQLCPSCGVKAGIIETEDDAPYDPVLA